MMKSRKIALWGIAAVASARVPGALALRTLTDSDHVKQIARDHIRKMWLRELTAGKLSLSFTPMPEYRATDVAVSNPVWAHDKAANGRSMKEHAASLTGPVTIDIGLATLHSKKLSDAETMLTGLTPFLSAKGADQVDLSCIGARLSFEHGIARGDAIVGIRSEASQLLTGAAISPLAKEVRARPEQQHFPVRSDMRDHNPCNHSGVPGYPLRRQYTNCIHAIAFLLAR